MLFRYLKQMPKLALALAVVAISTGIFALWWMFLKPKTPAEQEADRAARKMEIARQQALTEEIKTLQNVLFLADADLMEANSGKVLVKNFTRGNQPLAMWFDAASGKFIGRFPAGFGRFNVDGSIDKELGSRYGVQVSDDLSLAVYSEGGDIWTSEIDWKAFELVRPRRITSVGGFEDAFVLKNIMMANKDAMILQNMGQLVRVDLKSGNVTPVKMPMTQANERRSPDGGLLVGVQSGMNGQTVFMYDVATDTAKTADIGQAQLTGTLWLGEKKCCLLINSKELMAYNREAGTFEKLMSLPQGFDRLAAPSPGGRFVWCLSTSGVGIADLEKKSFMPVNFPPQSLYWIGDDTLLMARDIQDSQYRGTWVQRLDGTEATRVSAEPYIFDINGPGLSVAWLKEINTVIFRSGAGTVKITNQQKLSLISSSHKPFFSFMAIAEWKR